MSRSLVLSNFLFFVFPITFLMPWVLLYPEGGLNASLIHRNSLQTRKGKRKATNDIVKVLEVKVKAFFPHKTRGWKFLWYRRMRS